VSSAIVAALIGHRNSNLHSSTGELPDRGALPKDVGDLLYTNPLAFLIGVAFDRGMPWQKAWEIPYWIEQKGSLSASLLVEMTPLELQHLLESLPIRPRYGCKKGARTLGDIAALVMGFGGDASAIWRNASPKQVEGRLVNGIYGIGQGIAAMTVRILRDDWREFRGQEHEIDVKPDVHVMRVFRRTGLTRTETEREAVEVARELNPPFPGELDWPAWDIGQKWCRPTDPLCTTCPLGSICPKHV